MSLSLSFPSDRVDVYRAAAAALLAAAAIISLISPVQELEAEINSFRLSGGGPAARFSAGSAAEPTPTASPTVAVLSVPVLTAQAAEDGVELSWTTVHGATRYELLVRDSVNDWRQIGGDGLTGTTYTHTDLVAGTTYFYTIRAVNADGETSALSDHVSTDTPTATPTHAYACGHGHTHSAHLQATTGHTQRFQCRCCCRSYATQRSPTVAALAAPVLTAQASEDGVELSWTTVHGATRYELLVWDSVNEWRQIGGDSLTGTTYTYTDLVAGTTYFYIIRAVNADGETSAWSDQVSTVTATATATHTPAATATATHTPAATVTATHTPAATVTATHTPAATVTPTHTPAATATATHTAGSHGDSHSYAGSHGDSHSYSLRPRSHPLDTPAATATATHTPAAKRPTATHTPAATVTATHTPAATVTATHTPAATTGQPSDSSQNDVTVKGDSGNEGNVSPGQTSEDKTRTEPRQGLSGPTVTHYRRWDGVVVVGGETSGQRRLVQCDHHLL